MKLYTILDEKAGHVSPPFTAENDQVAERLVKQSMVPDSLLFRYPSDFALLRLGSYDDASGLVSGESSPILVNKLDVIGAVS